MDEEKKEEVQAVPVENTVKPSSNSNVTEKVRANPWLISTLVLGVLVVILLVTTFSGGLTGNVISKDKVGTNLVDFLNKYIVPEGGITLNSVIDNPTSGLYVVNLTTSEGRNVLLPISKDGQYIDLGNGLMNINAYIKSSEPLSTEPSNKSTSTEVPKTEKPSVELYVMSFCPFGNEAEKTMQSVYDLLKDKVDWKVHFIVNVNGNTVNSLHGEKEVIQDEREACVIKNYGVETWFKFANYVNNNCGSNGSCWQDAAKAANVDVNKINSCVTAEGLDLMKAEEAASNAVGAKGSPTLIINGVTNSKEIYQYGNSEAYKGAICEAFSTVPTQCSQKLSTASTAASGNCG